MPIRKKILIYMLVPAVLIGIVGLVGIISLEHLKQAAGRILSHNYHSIEELRKIERTLRQFVSFGNKNDFHLKISDKSLDELKNNFTKSLELCEKNITEKGEPEHLKKIKVYWLELKPILLNQKLLLKNRDKILSIINKIYDNIDKLIIINEQAMFLYEKKTRRMAIMMLWGVTASLFLAISALISFSFITAERISKPIVEVSNHLHKALNPDTSEKKLKQKPIDEIFLLREELEKLLKRLKNYENEHQKRLSHMQSRLAFVINEVLEGLVLIDNELRILTLNRIAKKILGITQAEDSRLSDLKPSEDVKKILLPILEGTFQPERDLGELKFIINGAERIYRPRVLTVSASSGDVEGYLLLFWDVTDQHRFEESRRKFISMLSHQLKTPMTSLTMSVNLLREKLKDSDLSQLELLKIASEDCNSLSGLVSELIEAAKEPSYDLNLKLRYIDIKKILQIALKPLIQQAKEKSITLNIYMKDLELKVWVDPVKFPWVIVNIVSNALRYTNKNGAIDVSILINEKSFTISISDTGKGISNEDLAYIFEPYISLETEPDHNTHGLGLAIAKEIVEAHKGSIKVESDMGRGTTFFIDVPFNAGEIIL